MKTHILCLGDSNTHGYCADPNDCADHGIRFNEDERWTCRLQKALGDEYLVTEEGLSGRTTVFVDPIHESMDALSVIYSLLKSHEVIDLLIIMLGTNDVKERFGANAACIAAGMERLILITPKVIHLDEIPTTPPRVDEPTFHRSPTQADYEERVPAAPQSGCSRKRPELETVTPATATPLSPPAARQSPGVQAQARPAGAL